MKITPLHDIHMALSAKMGEFAGYDMPLYYGEGVLKEHEWVRAHAGIFDVSHMGQVLLFGKGMAEVLEHLTPSAFTTVKESAAKYTVMTNEHGGIIDDLIVTKLAEGVFYAVINAGCKEKDIAWMSRFMTDTTELVSLEERSLIALQGPSAEAVMRDVCGLDLSDLKYMRLKEDMIEGANVFISRLGYTGEDGFEISIPSYRAVEFWDRLSQHPEVKPIGLAARDSLRLEMGYCLYGHDIDMNTTPLEADLGWVMGKDNTTYTGAARVKMPSRLRVGIKLTDKGIAREGAALLSPDGITVGKLTSGGFSPTLKCGIGQGYVDVMYAQPGMKLMADVRGNRIPAEVVSMPFIDAKTKATKK